MFVIESLEIGNVSSWYTEPAHQELVREIIMIVSDSGRDMYNLVEGASATSNAPATSRKHLLRRSTDVDR